VKIGAFVVGAHAVQAHVKRLPIRGNVQREIRATLDEGASGIRERHGISA
jgi:hypothetical protein